MKELITPEKLQIQIKILAKQLSDDHKNDKTGAGQQNIRVVLVLYIF